MYNPANGGWIGQRMQNLRTAEKKRSSHGISGETSEESSAESSGDETNTDEISTEDPHAKEVFEELKSMIFSDTNRPKIERNLKSCRQYRNSLLKIKETDLLESFPYFFSNPELVRDFFHTVCTNYYNINYS